MQIPKPLLFDKQQQQFVYMQSLARRCAHRPPVKPESRSAGDTRRMTGPDFTLQRDGRRHGGLSQSGGTHHISAVRRGGGPSCCPPLLRRSQTSHELNNLTFGASRRGEKYLISTLNILSQRSAWPPPKMWRWKKANPIMHRSLRHHADADPCFSRYHRVLWTSVGE